MNFNKHCKDINTWLNKVYKLEVKPNSKRLKESDYFEWLYNEQHSSFTQLEKTIKFLNKDYNNLPRTKLSENELYLKLKEIYKTLSKDLSSDNFDDIKNYLR